MIEPAKSRKSYPLSPMQQGMLFHYLSEERQGIDIEQVVCSLHEDLDTNAFEEAWRFLARRHDIFRTSFRWENLDEPLQDVHEDAPLPVEQLDWTELPETDRERELQKYLDSDRDRGFDLSVAPCMRLLIVKLTEGEFKSVWTFHHILLDGRTLPIALNEVFSFYETIRNGEEVDLPPPPCYKDYISWFRQQDWSKSEPFWREMLRGFSAPTPLPSASSSVGEKCRVGRGEVEIRLTQDLTSELKSFASESGVTLNTLVQAAWAILLSRYSGEEDVVFGAVRACRRSTVEGADEMVGLFINTLPMRVYVDPESTVFSLLLALRKQQVELRNYEHTPLTKVQEWSQLPGGERLFDSFIMFDHAELNTAMRDQGGAWAHREFELHEKVNYPLTLQGYAEPGLLLRIGYDLAILDGEKASRMLGHLGKILAGMVSSEGERISDLRMLTDDESHQILVDWNDTERPFPRDRCIHHLVEEAACRHGDRVAVICGNESLTYAQLNARSNQLARHLLGLGVGPESLVGVLMGRSLEMVVGLLGILKAGGAYLPLDPEYPADRLAFMLEDAACTVLLSQNRLRDFVPEKSPKTVFVDSEWDLITKESDQPCDVEVRPENLAYVIYTSGSTGRPKGVAIQHAGLVNLVSWHIAEYEVTVEDRATQVASLSFDAAVWEIWPYLAAGASLYLVDDRVRASAPDLLNWLHENRITLCFLPTPMAEEVLSLPLPKDFSLKALLTGGDKLQRIPKERTSFRLVNHYGPTENTVVSTFAPVVASEAKYVPPPIGRPITNTKAFVLDGSLQPVPIGVAGELHVSGVGLARGYLNRLDLTAEKFTPNPFDGDEHSRMYKTGDLVRYLPDGNIEFLGRIDHQVKIRGFRIELGEIENTLSEIPGVRQAIVVAREDSPGDKRLVAYLTARDGNGPTVEEMRKGVREKLPAYMVPSAFVLLEEFPLTPNGKIDRKALPAAEWTASERGEAFTPPRTETEETLAGIWAEVLGIEKVGVHDSFFDIGGHSFAAVRAISAVNNHFNTTLPAMALFEHSTIEDLGNAIESELKAMGVFRETADRKRRESASVPDGVSVVVHDDVIQSVRAKLARMKEAKGKPGRYRMRESAICKYLLRPLFRVPKRRFRLLLQALIARLEGGERYSLTLRSLYREYFDIHVGEFTCGCFDYIRFREGTRVGRYCSISPNCRCDLANHPRNTISPIGEFFDYKLGIVSKSVVDRLPRTQLTIGNDVYIPYDVQIIYPTSTIGNGVMIGAKSVVAGDVPPYAIAVGCPAQVVRFRFSKAVIEEVEKSKWWEKDIDDLAVLGDALAEPLEEDIIR